jgi:hypothetical protein
LIWKFAAALPHDASLARSGRKNRRRRVIAQDIAPIAGLVTACRVKGNIRCALHPEVAARATLP